MVNERRSIYLRDIMHLVNFIFDALKYISTFLMKLMSINLLKAII